MSAQTLGLAPLSVTTSPVNLLGLSLSGMQEFLLNFEAKPYVAQQLLQWLHQKQELNFAAMLNLSKGLRQQLSTHADLSLPQIHKKEIATDGTHKWLLRLAGGNIIETVFIPEKTRGTLCISSQAGCTLNCSFCATGKQGFSRHLTTAEIIGQLWLATQEVKEIKHPLVPVPRISNVVMMGMGEPLLNLEAVLPALDIMSSDYAYGLSKRRITVSTAGVVPGIERLTEQGGVSLALSLHAPNDDLRSQLVPLNKKYPIREVLAACRNFSKQHSSRITMEYVMLRGINDSISHAKELAKVVSNINCMINLIPFNSFPGINYQSSNMPTIIKFREELRSRGFVATIRTSRGEDVAAACGQLKGSIQDRTKRSTRFYNKEGKNAE